MQIKINLPKDFLKAEERCGYVVSEQMKKVWAVALDLLVEMDRICKKYNIPYYANSGTLLGAIRHKGIIPWDDDIDIMMYRSDYEKFCKIAEKECTYPYFLQTEYTDRGSLRKHAILKNVTTTAILKSEQEQCFKFNQSIGIDIFPVDAVVDDEILFHEQQLEAAALIKKCERIAALTTRFTVHGNSKIKKVVKTVIHKLFGQLILKHFDYLETYREFEKCCAKYNHLQTEKMSTLSFRFDACDFSYRDDFKSMKQVDFEFLTIPVCGNYDHALREIFGNYQEFVVGTSCHGDVLYDTDNPYTSYIQ